MLIGTKQYTENAGVITPPERYEFHWEAELKDNTKLKMFGTDGTYLTKIPFTVVQEKQELIRYIIWRGVNQENIHIGVTFEQEIPIFMVGGSLYKVLDFSLSLGHSFVANFFIRNMGDLESNFNKVRVYNLSMAYFAGFKFTYNEEQKEMYVSWDGVNIQTHGFKDFINVGSYTLT